MKKLSWLQVSNWRLRKHSIIGNSNKDFYMVIEDIFGAQSQVASSAELSVVARTNELKRSAYKQALYNDHTLFKTWMMRGTLHVTTPEILQLFCSARQYNKTRWHRYFEYFGISAKEFESYIESANHVLSSKPLTREQLAISLADHAKNKKLKSLIISKSWGSPLKPLAWAGYLCFGPNNKQNVTFLNPRSFISDWKTLDTFEAMREILRRYLSTYAPATVKQFTNWWDGSSGMTFNRKVFDSISDELEEVSVGNWKGFVLKKSIEEITSVPAIDSVRLLTLFDAYTIGIGRKQDIADILDTKFHNLVYRPQGWISAVIIVNGVIKGIWEYKIGKSTFTVNVVPFTNLTDSVKLKIEEELTKFSNYLDLKLNTTFKSI